MINDRNGKLIAHFLKHINYKKDDVRAITNRGFI